MADTYCDLTGGGTETSPYETWAKATNDIQTALTQAGAGGNCYVKCGATNTDNPDTGTGTITLTSPGTELAPTYLWGCKNGTTNEPPTNSDLTDKGDADAPIFENTSGLTAMTGSHHISGIEFALNGNLDIWSTRGVRLTNCLLDVSIGGAGILYFRKSVQGKHILSNVDINFSNATTHIELIGGDTSLLWEGGSLTGTAPTYLFDGSLDGSIICRGLDISGPTTLIDRTNASATSAKFENCKVNASVSLSGGGWFYEQPRFEMYNCSSATAISTSVILLEIDTYTGTISSETTRVRTGGADDGAAGGFSWAMAPGANTPDFPSLTLRSPPMAIWLDGTETTVTVYIANDSASTDMQDDEVWLDVWASDSTLDTAQYVLDSDRMGLLGTPANQTDDTGSTWGSGANNHQTLAVTIAPGYEGWAMCYVHCAERAASPKTVYVDPLPVLS